MYLNPLMVVCQWWHWMKQARSESLGADQHWDLVKWSLVTLCSTGEGEPFLTPITQCLALVQPHTSSPTSDLAQCMKWELHQWALLDWVDTAVEVGSGLRHSTVSVQDLCPYLSLSKVVLEFKPMQCTYHCLFFSVRLVACMPAELRTPETRCNCVGDSTEPTPIRQHTHYYWQMSP